MHQSSTPLPGGDVVKLAAKENNALLLNQRDKWVETIPVSGTVVLIGLMIALYFLYKRFFCLTAYILKSDRPREGDRVTVRFFSIGKG